MQIKTISTVAGVNEIDFGNNGSRSTAHFYWLKNLGDSTLYVSAKPNPVAEEDDVAELPAESAVSVETDEGKVYVLGAGKVEIHRTNSKFCPFECVGHAYDITANGNPVLMDGLQAGVPFSDIIVSGDDIVGKEIAVGRIDDNLFNLSRETSTGNGITFANNGDNSFDIFGSSTAASTFGIVLSNIDVDALKTNIAIFTMKNAKYDVNTFNVFLIVKTATGNKVFNPDSVVDCRGLGITSATVSFGINPGVEMNYKNVVIDLGVGDIVKITPDKNPYTIQNKIIQADGMNTVRASAGVLTVTGVHKNPIINNLYNNPIVLNVGAGREYTSFTDAVRAATQITDRKVIINVYAGEYDVYTELGGDDFIAGINGKLWFEIAPVLSGDVEIHGIGNVILKLNIPDDVFSAYTNDARKVSIIGTNRNISIENITFICSNCRYAIHDECDNNIDGTDTLHVFKNCRVYGTNAAYCAGIGTVSGRFIFENCYFSNTNGCFFLHDWNKSIGGNLTVANCIFDSTSGNELVLGVNSKSTFDVFLSNNNFEKLLITSINSSVYNSNVFRVIGVNNTIPSVTVSEDISNPYPVKLV